MGGTKTPVEVGDQRDRLSGEFTKLEQDVLNGENSEEIPDAESIGATSSGGRRRALSMDRRTW